MSESRRPALAATCAALSLVLAACASSDREIWEAIEARNAADRADDRAADGAAGPSGATPVAPPSLELPASADAEPRLESLRFLTGRWIAVNPNGTMNEEIWTPPRGNVSIGTFRQVRRDGNCAFVEISQIALEDDEIVLRLRHLHGRLEVPESRTDVSIFRLVSLADRRVEFAGTEAAAGVTSVVYERASPTVLVQSIGFSEESGEKPFITRYVLDEG